MYVVQSFFGASAVTVMAPLCVVVGAGTDVGELESCTYVVSNRLERLLLGEASLHLHDGDCGDADG